MDIDNIPSYLVQYFPPVDYTIPRAFDDEQAIMLRSKIELYLLSTLDQPSQIKKWLPQGAEGKLPSGETYEVNIDYKDEAFGCVRLNGNWFIKIDTVGDEQTEKGLSPKITLLELYRLLNDIEDIDYVALLLERKLRFTDKTLIDCLQKWQSYMLGNKFYSTRYFRINPNFQNGVTDIVEVVCKNGKKIVLPLRYLQFKGTNLKRPFYLPGEGLLYNQNRIHKSPDVFLTDNIEIAHKMPYQLKFSNVNTSWISWYGDQQAVSSIDWSVLKDKQVYYLIKRHSGFSCKEIYKTAYEVYRMLEDLDIEMKFIYWITGLEAISQQEVGHMPLVIEPKTFFEYASCWVSTRHLACFCSDSVHFIPKSFIKIKSLTLVYGPLKAGLTSLIQHRSFEIAKADYNVLYVSDTKSLQPTYASVDRFLKLGIPEDRLDITTEDSQILIDVELMRLEYENSRISLLVLDLKSLNRLSRSSEAVNCMSSWLQRLQKRNCAVIIVPPGKIWKAKALRSIKNIPFDNIIRVEKENSYDSRKIAMSLHYELIAGAEKFMKPTVLEYTYESNVWEKVVDKRVERTYIKSELTKLVKRGASNKDIAKKLGMKESLVKKRRSEFNLSKPWPHHFLSLAAIEKHNKNIYAEINKFLKAYSLNPVDISTHELFDEKIEKMYEEGMSARHIHDKIKKEYDIDIPLVMILQITEPIDKTKAFFTRPLDPVYPLAFFNFVKIQCRTGNKSIEGTICLESAVTMSGHRELLGMKITDIYNEKFIQEMVDNLKKRGIERFLIACVDDSKGYAYDVIKDSFTGSEVQKDFSGLVNESLAPVSKEDTNAVRTDLLEMFTAETKAKADSLLSTLTDRWAPNYQSIKQWRNQWKTLEPFFSYHPAIRKFLYSYNSSGFINKVLGKLHSQESLPTEAATIKFLYQELIRHSEKASKPVSNWKSVLNQLHKHFKGRFPL